jgi:hypothetical protein
MVITAKYWSLVPFLSSEHCGGSGAANRNGAPTAIDTPTLFEKSRLS